MKKIYIYLSLPILFGILTANVGDVTEQVNAVLSPPPPPPSEVILDLPEVPYEYEIGDLPPHLFTSDDPWSGNTDTIRINSITDPGATLGRVLFYDNVLSSTGDVSCGSCHKQELSFADEGAFSEGVDNIMTTRNSMHLNDIGWGAPFENLFWDFRANQLEKMVLQPIANEEELGGPTMAEIIVNMYEKEYYGPLFEEAFGDQTITTSRIASSISQFIRSMTTFNSRFDQQAANNFAGFTDLEETGRELFQHNCSICHSAPHFSNSSAFGIDLGFFQPMNNGLDETFTDLGAGEWMEDELFNGVFRSPSIRNAAITAPYMHDGRFETLEEVVDFYSDGIQSNPTSAFEWLLPDPEPDAEGNRGFHFTDHQKASLVAFMETLTDETFASNPKWSDPFVVVTSNYSPELLEGISIFPNPVTTQTTIDLSNPDGKTYQLDLTTIDGKRVKQMTTSAQQYTLNRDAIPAGIYLLKITTEGKMATVKVIMQ